MARLNASFSQYRQIGGRSPYISTMFELKPPACAFQEVANHPRASHSNWWPVVYIYIYRCVYIYMHVYIYVCIYIDIKYIIRYIYIRHGYLVGGIPTPLNNMSSSVGIMKFPTDIDGLTWICMDN